MKRSLTFSFGFGARGEDSIFNSNSSVTAGVTATSGIPHLGHLPGAATRTSGCIVQVYPSPCGIVSTTRPPVEGLELEESVLPLPPALASNFISHLGQLPGFDDCTSG